MAAFKVLAGHRPPGLASQAEHLRLNSVACHQQPRTASANAYKKFGTALSGGQTRKIYVQIDAVYVERP